MTLQENQPKDLDDAVRILLELTKHDHDTLSTYLDKEREFIGAMHMTLGGSLRSAWYLWWWKDHEYDTWPEKKPAIVDWFNRIEIYHADDMSSIILTTAYRTFFQLPIELDKQIERYHKHWLKNCGTINPMNH